MSKAKALYASVHRMKKEKREPLMEKARNKEARAERKAARKARRMHR